MFKRVLLVSLVLFVFAACSPQASNEVLPTLATIRDGDSAAPTEEASTSADATVETAEGDAPAAEADGPGNLELVESIESETGVTYQLPAGWHVNDNDSVSNFASDEKAVLDYISNDPERNSRWIFKGSVGTTLPDEVADLADAASFEEAAALLHAYYYTADSDIQPPTIITLANGNMASVSIRRNEQMSGSKASAVYFVDTGTGTYINVFFEAREDIMMDQAALRDAIANSAFIR